MDKAQNNLVNTYWRKRKIAKEQSSQYDYSMYELKYLLDSGRIKSEDFIVPGLEIDDYAPSYSKVYNFLENYPKYFDKFYTELNLREELPNTYVSELIAKHPEYIDKFDVWDMGKGWQGGTYIQRIIEKHPELINRFDLDELTVHSLVDIVTKTPKLINHVLDKIIAGQQHLREDDYIKLLNKFPELSNKFEYGYLSANERLKLLWSHPEVIGNLFKTYGDNMKRLKRASNYIRKEAASGKQGYYGLSANVDFDDLIERHPELQKYFDNI